MKIALFGSAEIKHGKHNLKDPRLDQADKLVEADKKTHAQVDVVGEDQLLQADAILALDEARADLILKDLEFVETRLGRDAQPAERAALEKIKLVLENERFLFDAGLNPEDLQAVAAHGWTPWMSAARSRDWMPWYSKKIGSKQQELPATSANSI